MMRQAARRLDIVDHLFTQAINLPLGEREAFVRSGASGESVAEDVLLMLRDYDRLSGFLDRPAVPVSAPEIVPGTLLADRFRVVEFVASGGMGSVYAAEDVKLSGPQGRADPELVAIKLCREELSNLPWLIDQFRQEIRLGRKVSHPRICRIHDVHEHLLGDGRILVFFSMELLRGPSLADAMRPPRARQPSEILPLLRALAEGLEAAHQAGIVHRDLKPGNVVMTANGPVITDFGLALTEPRDEVAHLSTCDGIVGSVPYMAPEQFRGRLITPAADIFAFGVIAYELIHGSLPFPSTPIAAALEARLGESYERLPRWASAVETCLRSDPGRRPRRAQDVVDRIEAASQPWSRRHALRWLAGTAAAATVGVVAFRFSIEPAVADGVPVLLLRVGGEADQAETDAMGTVLRTQLGQSAHFELLSGEQIAEALSRMRRPEVRLETDRMAARQVALRQGAVLLVAPGIVGGDDPRLRVEIEKLGSHPYFPLASWTEDFAFESKSQLMTALTEAGEWIREMTGERAAELAARARRPEEVTTGSWEALLSYTKAEHARSAGDDREAIRLLSSALELDPEFPAANMRLGDILMGHGQWHKAWMLSRKAATLVSQRGLTDRESLRIRGLFLHDSGDNRQAERVFEQWAAEFPGDYLPVFYLAACQNRLGRPADALDTLEIALERAPGNYHAVLMRAKIYMELGELPKARIDLDSVRAVNAWWWRYEAEFQFLSLDLAATVAAFDEFAEFGVEHESVRFLLRAFLFAECGDVEQALEELREGLTFDGARQRLRGRMAQKWIALSFLAFQQGDVDLALDAAGRAAEQRDDLRSLLLAAMLTFRCNTESKAQELWSLLSPVPDSPKFRELDLRVAGHRALSRREYAAAVEAFGEATRLGWANAPAAELAESLDLSGDAAAAEPLWSVIARYPGRYWLEPERYWPGTHRQALARMAPTDPEARRRLQAIDAARSQLRGASAKTLAWPGPPNDRGDAVESGDRGVAGGRCLGPDIPRGVA